MRISDWSSDVCSSDLGNKVIAVAGTQRRATCRYVVPGKGGACGWSSRQCQCTALTNCLVRRRNRRGRRKLDMCFVKLEVTRQGAYQRAVSNPHAVVCTAGNELALAAGCTGKQLQGQQSAAPLVAVAVAGGTIEAFKSNAAQHIGVKQ